jgi:hypothetical protein
VVLYLAQWDGWVRMEPFLGFFHESSKSLVVAARCGHIFATFCVGRLRVLRAAVGLSCLANRLLAASRSEGLCSSFTLRVGRPTAEPPRKVVERERVAMPASQSAVSRRRRPHLSPPWPSSTQANLFRALAHRPNLREAEVRAEGPRQVQNRRLPPRPSPRLSAVYRSRSRDMHRLRPARSCRICRLRRPQIGRRPGRSVMDARAGGRSGNPSASIISSRGREA